MFVRFVCSQPHPSIDAELGMFAAREKIDLRRLPGSLQRAHEEAFYWFSPRGGGGLLYPRLRGRARSSKIRKSLFWFREDASFWGYPKGSVVQRARNLAAVLSAAGTEIREIKVDDVGKVVWEDMKQVLAFMPENQIPRAFRKSPVLASAP